MRHAIFWKTRLLNIWLQKIDRNGVHTRTVVTKIEMYLIKNVAQIGYDRHVLARVDRMAIHCELCKDRAV